MMNSVIHRIRRLFSMAVLSRTTIKNKVKFLQVKTADEFAMDDIEHVEHFGFTSRALSGADAVLLSQGGNRGGAVCIMTHDRKYRIEINEGEAAIYNRHGDKVLLRNDRVIELSTPAKVLMNTPLVECNDLLVKGTATINDDAVISGVSFDGHQHRERGDGNLTGGPE